MTKFDLQVSELLALSFRGEHNIGAFTPIDFHSLLLNLKILTFFRPLSDDFSGMCIAPGKENRFILVNSNQTRGRQRFTLAHELYHLYYDENFSPHKCNPGVGTKNATEKAADAFAAALLMPAMGLLNMIQQLGGKKNIDITTIFKLEQYYSVSHASLLIRLKELCYISEAQRIEFAEYSPKETALRFGYDESLYCRPYNEGLILGDYAEVAATLFDKGRISEGHYLELLNLLKFEHGKD